jgi:hypothetical protein
MVIAGVGVLLAPSWLAAYITSMLGLVPASATQRLPLWSNAIAVFVPIGSPLPPEGVPITTAGAALVLDLICSAE